MFGHSENMAWLGADFDEVPHGGAVSNDTVFIAENLNDFVIALAPPAQITNQVRNRFKFALERFSAR